MQTFLTVGSLGLEGWTFYRDANSTLERLLAMQASVLAKRDSC
jgi:hypothetical protein